MVGVQQFHAPGGAVGEAAEGGVPGGLLGCAAQELRAQVASQKVIGDDVFIVPEVAELVVLGLEQKHVVKVNVVGIVHALAEQLAALQHGGLGADVPALGIYRTGIGGAYRPGGPGAHGVAGDSQPGGIDAVHPGKVGVGADAAHGAVGDGVAVAVGAVVGIEEGEVREVHHQLIPLCTADGDIGAVGFAVLAVGHGDFVVDITTMDHDDVGAAVAVFVQGQDDYTPSCQLHRVGGAGFTVILVAVEQQNAGSRRSTGGTDRSVELIGQVSLRGLDGTQLNLHISAAALDGIGDTHTDEDDSQKNEQQGKRLFYGL